MNYLIKIRQFIHSGGVDEYSYQNIKTELNESNRKSVMSFSGLVVSVLFVMTLVSFIVPTLSGNRLFYELFMIPGIIVFLASWKLGKSYNAMTFITYFFFFTILGIGMTLGTVAAPNEITATYIALMMVAPQFFSDRPYRMFLSILISVAVFICLVLNFKDPITWSSDITNSVLFGFVSCILYSYSFSNRVARFCLADTIRFMAENDQLTGLKNRNSFEQSIQRSAILAASSVYCVYADVNGLHELNNNKGHEAGDRMLQYVATVMQNIFGKECTYRIGGDEYVALGQDKTEAELREMIERFRQAVEAANYHVAVGLGHRPKKEIAMDALVRHAEQDMYADKRRYYQKNGIDRRRH